MIDSTLRLLICLPLPLLAACSGSEKSASLTDSGAAACEQWTIEQAQLVDEAELLGWLPGPIDFLPEHQGPGLAIGDLNGDGFLDGLLAVRSGGLLVLLNDGEGRFEEGFPLPLADDTTISVLSIALADLDGDGDLDAAVTAPDGHPDHILTNPGDGSPWSLTELEFSTPGSLTPSFGDWDQDGDLDLFVPGFADEFSAADSEGKPHRLYMQQQPGQFVLEAERLPETSRMGSGYLAQPFDVDLDGDLDLFLLHDLPFVSQLLLNDGTGHFTDGSEDCLCTQVRAAMGLALGDTNADGVPDFFVTGWQDNRHL